MKKVLVTGASGNVGIEILKFLERLNHSLEIYAGLRTTEIENQDPINLKLKHRKLDFTKIETFALALKDIDVLFLLRPPQISKVKKYFKPLIEVAKKSSVKHIFFLSVQGVEKNRIIPHYKIEKLVLDSKIPYTFLRPAYFMQNFTSTLRRDIVQNQMIYLPAGQAKFTIIDTADIGFATAIALTESKKHLNKVYELTNNEILTFTEMAEKISKGTGQDIQFISPNLLQFFIRKRKEGMPKMLILVMIILHFLPRFQKTPKTTDHVKSITGNEPKNFDDFIEENKNQLNLDRH